jgi:hypothetical protein
MFGNPKIPPLKNWNWFPARSTLKGLSFAKIFLGRKRED